MSNTHQFKGKWISLDSECQYTVFRKLFNIDDFYTAEIFIASNQFYKLFINGLPVCTNKSDDGFDRINISDYLMPGENLMAVLVFCENNRPRLIFDLDIDNNVTAFSDNTTLCAQHKGLSTLYSANSNFWLENYDSNCCEIEFEYPDFDDSGWENAVALSKLSSNLTQSAFPTIETNPIKPKSINKVANETTVDFGNDYIGQLYIEAQGKTDDVITICYGQDLIEKWTLSGGFDVFSPLLFKKIRNVKITAPENVKIENDSITLIAQK